MELIRVILSLVWTLVSTAYWFLTQSGIRAKGEIIAADYNAKATGIKWANDMFDEEQPSAITKKK